MAACCLSMYLGGLIVMLAFFHGASNPRDDENWTAW